MWSVWCNCRCSPTDVAAALVLASCVCALMCRSLHRLGLTRKQHYHVHRGEAQSLSVISVSVGSLQSIHHQSENTNISKCDLRKTITVNLPVVVYLLCSFKVFLLQRKRTSHAHMFQCEIYCDSFEMLNHTFPLFLFLDTKVSVWQEKCFD